MSIEPEALLAYWKQVSEANPIILFEQGWGPLGGSDANQLNPLFIDAARKDPTAAVRLIQHYAHFPFAPEVLKAAFRAFPSAAKTYPEWKEVYKGKPEVLKDLTKTAKIAEFMQRDNGVDNSGFGMGGRR